MAKYGINKVRGGSYTTKELSEEQYNLLTKEIRGATDACFRCGRKNHFIKDCYAKTDINNNIIEDIEFTKSHPVVDNDTNNFPLNDFKIDSNSQTIFIEPSIVSTSM